MKQHNGERSVKDPVCGMEISRKSAPEELAHLGKTYYICADVCRQAFEADPGQYLPHHRQHGMQHTWITATRSRPRHCLRARQGQQEFH